MDTYAVKNPTRLEWESGPDGTVSLVASSGRSRLVIAASPQRWTDLLLKTPRDRLAEARAMFERDEISVEQFERILEGR